MLVRTAFPKQFMTQKPQNFGPKISLPNPLSLSVEARLSQILNGHILPHEYRNLAVRGEMQFRVRMMCLGPT